MSLTSIVLYIARVNIHTHTSYCAEVKKATEAQYPVDKLDHLSDLQNDALESKFRNIQKFQNYCILQQSKYATTLLINSSN